jgi:RNA recognition motif-containing protein
MKILDNKINMSMPQPQIKVTVQETTHESQAKLSKAVEIQQAKIAPSVEVQTNPSRQLFIGNLPPTCHTRTLYEIFSLFGKIDDVVLFSSRGYGFVTYSNLKVSTFVKEQMTKFPPVVDGSILTIDYGREVAVSRQLFIANIPANTKKEPLKALFSAYGKVVKVKVFSKRGYAFVTFKSAKVAVTVKEHVKKFPPIFMGSPLAVQFGKAVDAPAKANTNRRRADTWPIAFSAPVTRAPSPSMSSSESSPASSPTLSSTHRHSMMRMTPPFVGIPPRSHSPGMKMSPVNLSPRSYFEQTWTSSWPQKFQRVPSPPHKMWPAYTPRRMGC